MPIPKYIDDMLNRKPRKFLYESYDKNGNVLNNGYNPFKTSASVWKLINWLNYNLKEDHYNPINTDEIFIKRLDNGKVEFHFKLIDGYFRFQDDYEDYNVKSIKSKLDKINIK